MTTPYTPEERERAERWLHECGCVITEDLIANHIKALRILNRLERREAEARELLSLARAASQTIAHKAEWAKRNGAWLRDEACAEAEYCPGCHAVNRNHTRECKRLFKARKELETK